MTAEPENMKPKKLVLSRKGFDTAAGGCPSPIFPDGTLYSLPIPGGAGMAGARYRDLHHNGVNIGQVVADLTRGRWQGRHRPHLDPDVRPGAIPRQTGWRGLFGQNGAAQSHLAGQDVGPGDIFLMFGLFRRIEHSNSGWTFVRGAPPQHILWGWLQIAQVQPVDRIRDDPDFRWAHYHDHFGQGRNPKNTLYIAREELDDGAPANAPGYGIFPEFDQRLALTGPGEPPSRWRLPGWFFPQGDRKPLTYHPDPGRWQQDGTHTLLRSVGRGQEFVLNLRHYPQATDWAAGLIRELGARP